MSVLVDIDGYDDLLSQFVPTARKVTVFNVVTYSLCFPLSLPRKKLKDMASQTTCSCGKGFLCQRTVSY